MLERDLPAHNLSRYRIYQPANHSLIFDMSNMSNSYSDFVCSADKEKCADGLQCVRSDLTCNGVPNCKDGSDESTDKCGMCFLLTGRRFLKT